MIDLDKWFKRQLESLCDQALYAPRTDEAEARFKLNVHDLIREMYQRGGTVLDHNGEEIQDPEAITLFVQRDQYEVSVKAFKRA
jgi:hypothetical protein